MPYPTNTPTQNSIATFGNIPLPEPPGGYPPTEPAPLPEGQFPAVNSNSLVRFDNASDKVSWDAKGSLNKNPIYGFTNLTADCGAGVDQYYALGTNPLDEFSFPLNPEVPSVCQWQDLTIYDDVSQIADNGFQSKELKGAFNFLGDGITIGDESFASFGSSTAYFGSNLINNCTLKDGSFRSSEIKGPITFYSPDISLAKNCFYNAFFGGGELFGLYDFGNRIPISFAENSAIKNLQISGDSSCIIEQYAFNNCTDLVSANIEYSKAAVFGERCFKGIVAEFDIIFPAEAVSFHKESFSETFFNGYIEFYDTLVANNISFAGNNDFSQNERVFYEGSFRGNVLSQKVIDLSLTNGDQIIGRSAFSQISADYSTFKLYNADSLYKVSIGPEAFKDSYFKKIDFRGNELLVEYGAFNCVLQSSKTDHINLNFNNYEIWDEAFLNAKGKGSLTHINIENGNQNSLKGHHTFKIETINASKPAWNSKSDGELACWYVSLYPDPAPENPTLPIFGMEELISRPLRGDSLKLGSSFISSNGFSLDPPAPYINEESQAETYGNYYLAYSVSDMEYMEEVIQTHYPEPVSVTFYGDQDSASIQIELESGEILDFERVEGDLPMGGKYQKLEFAYEKEVVIGDVPYIEFANMTFYDATDPFWDASVETYKPVTGEIEIIDNAFGGVDPINIPGGWVIAYSLVEESNNAFASPVFVSGYKWYRNGDPGSFDSAAGNWETIVIQNFTESARMPIGGPSHPVGEGREFSVDWYQSSSDQTSVTMSDLPDVSEFPTPEEAAAWYKELKKLHLICGTVNGF